MLDTSYFGEGITILNGNLYQLTWEDHKGFIYNAETFDKVKEFKFNGEGWALTNDGINLIMSNGSSILQYLDPNSLKVLKKIYVQDNMGPVGNLNEIEFIDGFIYANQYLTNYILKIEIPSGNVVAKADFSVLVDEVKKTHPNSQELNGIAYDSTAKNILITGKAWPYIYRIKFQ